MTKDEAQRRRWTFYEAVTFSWMKYGFDFTGQAVFPGLAARRLQYRTVSVIIVFKDQWEILAPWPMDRAHESLLPLRPGTRKNNEMEEDTTILKKENLISHFKKLDSLLVAFSGGVDSTFLLSLAHQTLGDKVVAVTASSIIHPAREMEDAGDFTRERGIHHIVFRSEEMTLPEFVINEADRCYHCKRSLFQGLFRIAKEKGLRHVAHAANVDDLRDYRPGFRAAKEAGVIAPLIDAQVGKEEIRLLSKEMGLSTWDKPAMACLASRIPYGSPVTEKKLKMVEEAEAFLLANGFKEVRVRHHGSVARIEVEGSGIKKITGSDLGKNLVEKLRRIGFLHIAIDLEGYVSGSMNRALRNMREKGAGE